MPLLISRIAPLLRRRVLVLDDRRNPPVAALDAAVAGRDRRPPRSAPSRPRRCSTCRSTSACSVAGVSSGTSPDSRTTVPVAPASACFGLQQSMTRAELGLLQRELKIRPCRQRRAHGVRLVADDDDDGGGGERVGGAKHVLDEWQAGRGVQNLRKTGFHPRSLAGRKDDEVERVHRRLPGPARGLVPRARRRDRGTRRPNRSGSRSGS